MSDCLEAFRVEPQYRDYIWGGKRLRPGQVTAEAWIMHENDQILSGQNQGRTLAEVTRQYGAQLVGEKAFSRTGDRFPLLIKLLDCADWLSLQVHPNDQQAITLEGPGQFGKTEAWHILDADPNAKILCGFRPGVSPDEVRKSVMDGSILDYTQKLPLSSGDTIFIPAGTLHALGPGLLVYEVQQTSDITYRVFDWNRPASAGRKLHIEQSLAVTNPAASSQPIPEPDDLSGAIHTLVSCPYFRLDLLSVQNQRLSLDTKQASFHALTIIQGSAIVSGSGWQFSCQKFDTLLIPACLGVYELQPITPVKALKSSVE